MSTKRKAAGKAPVAETQTPALPVPCDHRRILIVDDESAIRSVFKRVVSIGLPNCRTDVAVNGAEAVEYFRSAHQGLLLIDLQMPVMDGQQAFYEIERLCQAENWKMPAFVFCTGFLPPEAVQEIVAKDPKHCLLRKPVSIDMLLDALKARLPPQGA